MSDKDNSEQLEPDSTVLGRLQFVSVVRYEGTGHAEFEDPHGYITGTAWVEFSETGVARGGLAIEQADADEHLPLGLQQFFWSQRPVAGEEPGSLALAIGLESKANKCVALGRVW